MKTAAWGLRGGLLAAALSLTTAATAEPPDPIQTAEDTGGTTTHTVTSVAAYGIAPRPRVHVIAVHVIATDPRRPTALVDGTWQASGSAGQGIAWSTTLTVSEGSYTLDAYPPLSEAGRVTFVRGVEVEEDGSMTIHVRFSERVMKGAPLEDREETWRLSADKQTLSRDGATFTRAPAPAPTPTQPDGAKQP